MGDNSSSELLSNYVPTELRDFRLLLNYAFVIFSTKYFIGDFLPTKSFLLILAKFQYELNVTVLKNRSILGVCSILSEKWRC